MIRRLNHAVLWVRDAQASAAFYRDVLGFQIVADLGPQAAFLRADGSDNDHDLGLFSVGARPAPPPHSPGLYHLAWQVHTIEELAAVRTRLA
ncbi:MAG: VOC family protein, partial [Actinobacteria bacterium]|nr:VOC family protein [Actinomycetota bacterium]